MSFLYDRGFEETAMVPLNHGGISVGIEMIGFAGDLVPAQRLERLSVPWLEVCLI